MNDWFYCFCVGFELDEDEFEHSVFVHVIDQSPQDSKLVVAILTDILSRLKAHDPSIKQACIRSDNAGCYHSVSTLLSIPTVSQISGISIRRMDFADPQGGKGKAKSELELSGVINRFRVQRSVRGRYQIPCSTISQ